MILKFAFENAFSFKEAQELNLIASAKKERLFDDSQNYVEIGKNLKILRSSVLYGANASGKSNLINALVNFSQLILSGNQNLESLNLNIPFFRLATKNEFKPTVYEIE
jgi:AAA15 family ATPase/GTPase